MMGMPITIEVVDAGSRNQDVTDVFAYFNEVDRRFSTYKPDSEISRINRGAIGPDAYSQDMKTVLTLCEETKRLTRGFFDIARMDGTKDPSGLVKGWAINHAAAMLRAFGHEHFFVDAGGDIQTSGRNASGKPWSVGIKNPFNRSQIVQVVYPNGAGIATSGTYIRGQHVYNPHDRHAPMTDIVSLTVIGPNIYEADRFATAAFAMGREGIAFIGSIEGFEGYMIDKDGMSTSTNHFATYTQIPA